jgi:Spherulation-specific family 4
VKQLSVAKPHASHATSSGSAKTSQSAAIPAYWYPDSTTSNFTKQVLNTQSGDVSFIIADPSSGPGSSVDSSYVSAINNYERQGIKVYGYVYTDYGTLSLSSVEAQVSDWYSWYGVDGIFFDDASSDPALAGPGSYYNELYQYVKNMTGTGVLGTTVILNPGTVPAQAYMADADVICDFEGPETTYVDTTFPAWVKNYSASRFWNIVYDSAGIAQMKKDVSLARARNAGHVFVTTQSGSNPYAEMPSGTFWSAEVSALTKLTSSTANSAKSAKSHMTKSR